MAFIEITTNNLSRELSSTKASIDNWVYVPGNTITGDYKKVMLFTNVEDFKNTCGNRSPESSRTFEYVTGLLSAGMPVMFRRIACVNQDSNSEEEKVIRASGTFQHGTAGNEIVDFMVEEKYGGSFGNDMRVTYKVTTNGVAWLDVYLDRTLLERKRLGVRKGTVEEDFKKEVMKTLKDTEFERIRVTVLNKDISTFDTSSGERTIQLDNGKDFPDSLMWQEIPHSYKFIEDKMLFKPKFITSGGYADGDGVEDEDGNVIITSTESTPYPIAEAMEELTKKRQDCAAIIDLPMATSKEEYEEAANQLSYTQLTDNSPIESARIFGPWVYMKIGADNYWMPPSYAYLTTMGNRLAEGKKSYNPVAGLSTGVIKNVIRTEFEVGSDIADDWQADDKININPIMKINGSSYAIGGNSTLLTPEEETGENNLFLESSADLTVIDIRRFVYNLATELQYQYNAAEVFETFGLRTSDYLDRMISEGAVTDYAIYNESSDLEPRKLKIRLDVYLSPTVKKVQILLNVGYGSIEFEEGGNS